LEEFDEYLSASMLQHIRAGHFDFLHGALGMALYLLKHRRSDPAVEAALREVIEHLEAQATRPDNNKMYWLSSVSDTEHGVLNIALSHGITAVAMLLCRYIKEDLEPLRCREMLEKVVAQIMGERIDEQVHGSCFPSTNKERDQRHLFSRLGWCYGDLGIALMLWQCGNAIDRADWKAEALRIFQFNCKRRDAGANHINDAGLCHGAAGVALIFQRMYRETGLPEFLETAQYWHAYTLQMAVPGEGIAGYKVYATKPIPIADMNRNLLEGVAGIGMCLLHADLELSQDWDAVFLLSM
jgi:lantibiotic biosynthesis protein